MDNKAVRRNQRILCQSTNVIVSWFNDSGHPIKPH